MKDLRTVSAKIEQLLQEELDLDEKPAFAITFTLPPSYKKARWATNVERPDGIRLFEGAAERMQSELN